MDHSILPLDKSQLALLFAQETEQKESSRDVTQEPLWASVQHDPAGMVTVGVDEDGTSVIH